MKKLDCLVDIERIIKLFQQEKEKVAFAEEVYRQLTEQSVQISPPFTIEADKILLTYSTREKIQREVNKRIVALGYEVVLPGLAQEKEAVVSVFKVASASSGYMIFADELLTRIIGILKLPYSNSQKYGPFSGETFEKGTRLKE